MPKAAASGAAMAMLSLICVFNPQPGPTVQLVNRRHSHGKVASDFRNFRTAQTFGKLQNARIGAVLD
jgi:hypothetical protein